MTGYVFIVFCSVWTAREGGGQRFCDIVGLNILNPHGKMYVVIV